MTREDLWRDLGERGFHCVYDGEYGPEMNADAAPLFTLYPRLLQRHGNGIWCTAPGLTLLAAFRIARDHGCSPRPTAARIASAFSDAAAIAMTDALGHAAAVLHISSVACDNAEELNPTAYINQPQ